MDCNLNHFLKPEYHNPSWGKGIKRSWLKNEWNEVLKMVQRYITYEGRFSIILLYHMRFLFHLFGDKIMNLPFFLLKSLRKMSSRVQASHKRNKHIVFHQGLIKLLIVEELNKKKRTWQQILSQFGFKFESQKPQKK
jgi:hypothetical protein